MMISQRRMPFQSGMGRRTVHAARRLRSMMANVLALLLVMAAVWPGLGDVAAAANESADLDVLFIGAHPDDEAGSLSTFGQWLEYEGVRTGVITVTRGEGGGNAAGPEEGAALGLIREMEERKAVGKAGITRIYNLDKLDFYYTVSAPLTEQIWGHDSTLENIVRIVRMARPEIIVTMNPSPTPGNHGNHQYAARLAVEAFYAAADPDRFPEQISEEGLSPWRVKKIFLRYANGTGETGAICETSFQPAEPTDQVYGIWNGRFSEQHGKSWGQVEREAMREYVTQGWSVFPDLPSDPEQLGCDYFTELDSRVPGMDGIAGTDGMLAGALKALPGGLPLGTELVLTADAFQLVKGQTFTVTAHLRNGTTKSLPEAVVQLEVPKGWKTNGKKTIRRLEPGRDGSAVFTVTVPKNADLKRVRLKATVTAGTMQGTASRVVSVVPDVAGAIEPLPQVAQFRAWTQTVGVPQLDHLIKPLLSIGVGETRPLLVELRNNSRIVQSGNVELQLPDGFQAEPAAQAYRNLQPGQSTTIVFQLRNSDPNLKTSNEGGNRGDYDFTVRTTSGGGSSVQNAAINLVPVTVVAKAETAPVVDGVISEDEYPGTPIDISRLWEGEAPESAADASGFAHVVWHDDALYFAVVVTDDVLGAVLTPDDAKRHWRTDSVEIAIDPRGDSENTSTTFKVGIFPTTDDAANGNPAAAYRDADHRQGPIAKTAPGMVVRATISEPYTGYTIEAKIPFADLPASVDPERMGLNIFIYDSDTQDKTGQTRLGWSTWGGVQGDPYRWGHAVLSGYEAVGGIGFEAARSVTSPLSILQSLEDGIPLAGGRDAGDVLHFVSDPRVRGGNVTVELRADVAGTAHLFLWKDGGTLAYETVDLSPGRTKRIQLSPDGGSPDGSTVLAAFETDDGAATVRSANVAADD